MPKDIPPVMGHPLNKAIEPYHAPSALLIIHRLNPDLCLTEDQILFLESMFSMAEITFSKDVPSIELNVERVEKESAMVAEVNGYRLDCDHCLNGECPFRDPKYPVGKVQERAERMNTYWVRCSADDVGTRKLIADARGDVELFERLYREQYQCEPVILSAFQLQLMKDDKLRSEYVAIGNTLDKKKEDDE